MARATKSSLVTLGDFFHFAVARFRTARLAYGHGTTNAVDEAAFMVLEALRLPITRIDPWLDLVPTAPEKARLLTLIEARIALRSARAPVRDLSSDAKEMEALAETFVARRRIPGMAMALVPDMPMTLSGKVLKRELLEQWAAAQSGRA